MDCPDVRKVQIVVKEIEQLIHDDLCIKGIYRQQINWIKNTALPQIMTKSFLGVEPPVNWFMMADELFDCYTTGNLCSKTVQEQVAQCSLAKMPIILFQLSPWLTEHCIKLNEALLDHWPEKKSVVKRLLNEYTQQ